MILGHLQQYWDNHIAAFSATLFSLSISGMLQSVIVGVLVFVVTSIIKLIAKWLWNKLKCKGNNES